MNAIAAVAEAVGLAIYRILPRRVRQYVEYDSMLGHILVLFLGVGGIACLASLVYALAASHR